MLPELEIRANISWVGDFRKALENGELSKRPLSEKSALAYELDIKAFAQWFFDEYKMLFTPEQITGVDLRNYRRHCLEISNCKPSTWNRKRISLRKFCQWGVKAGHLSQDPSADLQPKEVEELPPRWLERKDAQRLVRLLEQDANAAGTFFGHWEALRNQAMIGLMLYAGLREHEVVQLNWGDIEMGERSGRVRIRKGKGDKWAEIPLGIEARRLLQAWIAKGHADAEPIFRNKSGSRLSTRSVQRIVKELGIRAKIHLTPHALRHTFAKRLVDGDVPVTTVQKLMRHARLETTARYMKPGWGDLEQAVEKV